MVEQSKPWSVGKRLNRGLAAKALLVLLAIFALASVTQGCRNALAAGGSVDLGLTLKPATLLLTESPYIKDLEDGQPGDPSGRTMADGAPAGENPFMLTAVQMPSALMLLWPLSGLSWAAAKLVWLLANLAFTAGTLWLACKRYLPGRSPWIYAGIACLLAASFPWRVAIGNGQHIMAALFFFLLAAELADRGRPFWAGAALGVSFVKYSVTLFLLPLFVAKRQFKPVAIALAAHLVMTLGIAIHLGESPVRMVAQSLSASRSTVVGEGYADLFALADWLGWPASLAAVGSALLVSAGLWLALRRRHDESLLLAFLCAAALLIAYHRLYDSVVLLISLIAIAARPTERPLQLLVASAVIVTWFVTRLIVAIPPQQGWALRLIAIGLLYAAASGLFARLLRTNPDHPAATA